MSNRVFNRRMPPALPAHMMLKRTAAVPTVVDLRPWDGPVKDQGDEGCCTGETGAEIAEWVQRKYLSKLGSLIFSPQFAYVNELAAQGSFPNDDGSDGKTLCETMIANGCCEESLFPFRAGQIMAPTDAQKANAAKHRLFGAYHGIADMRTALTVLGDPIPWPIAVGFNVPESFDTDEVADTGIMLLFKPGEDSIGGHEVKLSGHDVGTVPTIRPANCPPAVLVQNSWGPDWGLDGYFWMPLQVLDRSDTDMKIMHSGKPWGKPSV